MPALGRAQEPGKLVRWIKNEGDAVAKGEPLMEIETDKVTVEIEAPADGFLGGISAVEGEDVPVGRAVPYVLPAGEEPPVSSTVTAALAPAPPTNGSSLTAETPTRGGRGVAA